MKPTRFAAVTAVASSLALAASCTLDFDQFEQQDAAAVTSAGGSGVGGTTSAGGSGGTTSAGGSGGTTSAGGGSCGNEPTPPGGSCPSECTGGCDNNVCVIACDEFEECRGDDINCPADFACELRCSQANSCRDATLNCPDTYACTAICDSFNSCRSLTVECSATGTCGLSCNEATDTCRSADLNCGDNACTASCDMSNRTPSVDCGNSCNCTECP